MSDNRHAGAEALVRWQHPEHGPIAPSVFIDVAEQSGLIEIIGPAVLRAACADAMRWTDEHPDADGLFVSVNVSPRQLRNGDLSEQVAQALARSEEHTSELQSLMRISYAVFCLKKKNI